MEWQAMFYSDSAKDQVCKTWCADETTARQIEAIPTWFAFLDPIHLFNFAHYLTLGQLCMVGLGLVLSWMKLPKSSFDEIGSSLVLAENGSWYRPDRGSSIPGQWEGPWIKPPVLARPDWFAPTIRFNAPIAKYVDQTRFTARRDYCTNVLDRFTAQNSR